MRSQFFAPIRQPVLPEYYGLLADCDINSLAAQGMISPYMIGQFKEVSITEWETVPAISYGTSSYGYDARLSPMDFVVFKDKDTPIDPKAMSEYDIAHLEPNSDETGTYFILPPHTYAEGVTVEHFKIPEDILVVCLGKSTYARSGVHLLTTPLEPGWEGHITLEFVNLSNNPVKVYANEGFLQLLFFRNKPCIVSYSTRKGKYQGQPQQVVLPRV